jgi:hypothetical protein
MQIYFPTLEFALIMGLSILCAFFSTFGPTSQLMRKEIASIFRLV